MASGPGVSPSNAEPTPLSHKQTVKISKIREIFSILAQGVELNHYYMVSKGVSACSRKTMWLDSEALRICVGENRLNVAAKKKEIVPDGVYIKDISEIREGCVAHAFACYPEKDFKRNNRSLTIVATETCLSLELTSEDSRNWFLERLRLMADDMLSVPEIRNKRDRMRQIKVEYTDMYSNFTEEEIQTNTQLKELLVRGIQVNHHFNGEVISSIITYDLASTSLVILPIADAVKEEESGYWGLVRKVFGYFMAPIVVKQSSVLTVALNDISDVRIGSHAYGFVLTNSTDKHEQCLSIIGSQATISVELSSETVRNIFADRLRKFIFFAILEYRHCM